MTNNKKKRDKKKKQKKKKRRKNKKDCERKHEDNEFDSHQIKSIRGQKKQQHKNKLTKP